MSSNLIIGVVGAVAAGVTAGCCLLRRWSRPQEQGKIPFSTATNVVRTDNLTIVNEISTFRGNQQELQQPTEKIAEKQTTVVKQPVEEKTSNPPKDDPSANKPVTPADPKPSTDMETEEPPKKKSKLEPNSPCTCTRKCKCVVCKPQKKSKKPKKLSDIDEKEPSLIAPFEEKDDVLAIEDAPKTTEDKSLKKDGELKKIDPDVPAESDENTFKSSFTVCADNLPEVDESNEDDRVSITLDLQTSLASVVSHPFEVRLVGPVDSVVNATLHVDEVPSTLDEAKPVIPENDTPTESTDLQEPTESKEKSKKHKRHPKVQKHALVKEQRPSTIPIPPPLPPDDFLKNIPNEDSTLQRRRTKNKEGKKASVGIDECDEELERKTKKGDVVEVTEMVLTTISYAPPDSADKTKDPNNE